MNGNHIIPLIMKTGKEDDFQDAYLKTGNLTIEQ